MRVVFYLDSNRDDHLWFTHKAVLRARQAMPGTPIVLLTIPGFDAPHGFDEVMAFDVPGGQQYAYRKCQMQSRLDGENIFIGSNCFVRKDIRHVFNADFDVALCLRYLSPNTKHILFNGGVCFSRCPEFWSDLAERIKDAENWEHVERALTDTAMQDKYVVRGLNGDLYNYFPETPEDDLSGKYVVHYKGERTKFLYPGKNDA